MAMRLVLLACALGGLVAAKESKLEISSADELAEAFTRGVPYIVLNKSISLSDHKRTLTSLSSPGEHAFPLVRSSTNICQNACMHCLTSLQPSCQVAKLTSWQACSHVGK